MGHIGRAEAVDHFGRDTRPVVTDDDADLVVGPLCENLDAAMREIRIALIEADVALPVVKDFINAVREKAVGEEVLRSVTPAQMVVKLVHDNLVAMLGAGDPAINLNAVPPAVIMVVGLQGSGKTTSAAKIARLLQTREKKKVLLASLDVARPAAQEQLAVLARQIDAASLPIVAGEKPVSIAKRAIDTGRREGFDVLILDTAGRLHVDEPLMQEVAAVHQAASPAETLLVVDSLSGQDAVNVGKAFASRLPITGIMLTRIDGDARGGAALSMRAITGKPIKLLGTGEKLDAIERSMRRASPAASSAWATSSVSWRRPLSMPIRPSRKSSRARCSRAASISTTSPAS